MTPDYVIDAWSVMAWFQDEQPACAEIAWLLAEADEGRADLQMSVINAGEVFYKTWKSHGRRLADNVLAEVVQLPLRIVTTPDALVWAAVALKAQYPISYADGFAAALALQQSATLLTGDPDFAAVERGEGLEVQWLPASDSP